MSRIGPYRPDWDPGTWECHICKTDRPDANISVFKHHHKTATGVEWSENVRYCNDNPDCIAAAPHYHHVTPGLIL